MKTSFQKPAQRVNLYWENVQLEKQRGNKYDILILFTTSISLAKEMESSWEGPFITILPENKYISDSPSNFIYLQKFQEDFFLLKNQITRLLNTFFTSKSEILDKKFFIINSIDSDYNSFKPDIKNNYNDILFYHYYFYKIICELKAKGDVIHISLETDSLKGIGRGFCLSLNKEIIGLKFRQILIDDFLSWQWILELPISSFPKGTEFLRKDKLFYRRKTTKTSNSNEKKNILKENDVIIITGGNGKIGQQLARYLIEKYQCQLILIGRKSLPAKEKAELKNLGITAYIEADISDPIQTKRLWKNLEKLFPKIHGIFHLAGVLEDRFFLNKKIDEFHRVISPKFLGIMNLDLVSKDHPLDFFIGFSSLSSIVGNIGQTDYSIANALMDDYILHRSSLVNQGTRSGLTQTINWGLWEEGGMLMEFEGSQIYPMASEECFQFLEEGLRDSTPQTIISRGGIEDFSENEIETVAFTQNSQRSFDNKKVQSWIQEKIYKTTKLKNLKPNESLIDLGTDSIAIVNMVKLFEADLKKQDPTILLNKALIFEHQTISKILNYFQKNHSSTLCKMFPLVQSRPATDHLDTFEEKKKSYREFSKDSEAIAIIGMAGRFPGAENTEAFWKNLSAGVNSISVIPKDRWDWKRGYSPDPNAAGKSYGRHGGFLPNIKTFDPLFFGISPSDAKKIDPQERLLLETVYHSLEDAALEALPQKTGVFIAVMFGHYRSYQSEEVVDTSFSSIANRISFFFDFHGPSIAIDTMCSGSLTALHLAVTSLRNNECELAIVCGVNLMPHPVKYRLLSQGKFLSKTGKCHSFGQNSDGYVPGEGVTAIVLKRSSLAIENNDKIHGIICGSAINSGGRTSGFTVPSIEAQSDVIKGAIDNAKIEPKTISYIEAHGTGTSLGDPIELEALKNCYGKIPNQRCPIGAVKSNIGHLESAAGLAGLIKILLQLKYQTIVPTINCEIENPHLNLQRSSFFLPHQKMKWQSEHSPLRAAISSFGAGGANAHVIIEQTPSRKTTTFEKPSLFLFCLSSNTGANLQEQKKHLQLWLESHDCELYDLAYYLSCCRKHHKYRAIFISQTKEELINALSNLENENFKKYKLNQTTQLQEIGQKYIKGEEVNFKEIYTHRSVLKEVPKYAFEKGEYWIDTLLEDQEPKNAASKICGDLNEWSCFVPSETIELGTKEKENNSHLIIISNDNSLFIEKQNTEHLSIDSIPLSEQFFLELLNKYPGQKPRILLCSIEPTHKKESLRKFEQALFFLGKAIVQNTKSIQLFVIFKLLDSLESDAFFGSTRGFLKILPLENPRSTTRLIKINNTEDLSAILEEIWKKQNSPYEEIILDETRKVIHFKKKEIETFECQKSAISQNGNYLITGAMGYIGQVIAQYLASKYQANLFLIGSSPLDQKKIDAIKKLRGFSKKVEYFQTDLTDYTSTVQTVKSILEIEPDIQGIFYCAGRIQDQLLKEKNFDVFQKVSHTKSDGVVHIDLATKDVPLDFFLLFSSIASVFGNVGQSDYAFGNAFLDEFAKLRNDLLYKRKIRRGHTTSINWPLWTNGSDQIDPLQKQFLFDQFGLDSISDEEGIHLMEFALNKTGIWEENQIAIVKGKKKKIESLILHSNNQNKQQEIDAKTNILSVESIIGFLRSVIIDLLGHDKNSLENDNFFGDLGFNSIGLQKFAKIINKKYNTKLTPSLFFTHNNIEKLSKFLTEKQLSNLDIKQTPIVSKKVMENIELTTPHQPKQYAIIGMCGIMPGAKSLGQFWENLIDGKQVIQSMKERWPTREYFGGLVSDMESFDPKFFGMSAREAMLMDPQHRLFLEIAYNTFLDAGYTPSQNRDVGVFAGVQFNDYQILLQQWKQSRHPYAATGNAHALLANRVSYCFDFHGPSQTIDTACSSSIVALKRAIFSLESKECNFALVGAASLLIDPEVTDTAKSMGVLSPNYRCATFDSAADGYVRSEGVGCILIKPLDEAKKDKDHCYGIIREVVENHGGKAHSLTAPNPEAQKALLIKAYQDFPIEKVNYIEAHGTGTKLGDPIEIEALKSTWEYFSVNQKNIKIPIGSVKTHIGHLEPAAGMASLFKVLLSMKYQRLPKNLNFKILNPYIELENSPFYILNENESWTPQEGPKVAGISCFGFGGSNAHAIIEESNEFFSPVFEDNKHYFVPLSAKDTWSLENMKRELIEFLKKEENINSPHYSIRNIAFTLSVGREHFVHRAGWIASTIEELIDAIETNTNKNLLSSSELSNLKERYLQGKSILWSEVYFQNFQKVSLPGYSFHRQAYWFEDAADRVLEEVPLQ